MGKRKQPFGYRMKMGEIVLHPQEANLVAYIFQQYITGATFNTLVQELKDQPIPYYEGKAWKLFPSVTIQGAKTHSCQVRRNFIAV